MAVYDIIQKIMMIHLNIKLITRMFVGQPSQNKYDNPVITLDPIMLFQNCVE